MRTLLNDHPGTQLYLVAEADDAEANLARFEAALGVERVASVLVVPVAGNPIHLDATRYLLERTQKRGLAGLIAGSAEDAARTGADGVHVLWSETAVAAFADVRGKLGSGSIVGVDAGRSRHDAMTLGDSAADYIAFGIPEHVQDRDKAAARRLELIFWWSEIFEVPCVAFDVATPEEARELAAAGADFVAVRLPSACTPADAREHIQRFADAVSTAIPAMT